MEEQNKCPICKGVGFLKSKRFTVSDIEYLMYKRCECMKKHKAKTEHQNPFKEGENTHGVTN